MKQIFIGIFISVLSWTGVSFAQDNLSFNDKKISAFSKVEHLEDRANDRFYDYYNLTIENISEDEVTFVVTFEYNVDGQDFKSDSSEEITLNPSETIKGNRKSRRDLTLFKSFNEGNSGKKASEKNVQLVSFNIIYL